MSHLSFDERTLIQTMLNEKCSLKSIAKKLERPTSTISREVKNHISVLPRKTPNACGNFYNCKRKHVCSGSCTKQCRNCPRCVKHCPDYIEDTCELLLNSPYVCNGCNNLTKCKYERHFYKACVAQETYKKFLKDSREGFSITKEQLQTIDEAVSPLIRQGLSPYHVAQTLKNSVPVSESTIYRMINSTQLSARNIDLINKVKRKERKHRKTKEEWKLETAAKNGHRYKDYLEFQEQYDLPVVELDCVEGSKEDKAVLMTLHFVSSHMQLAFILNNHTAEDVVNCLDMLEITLSTELYMQLFPLILTDNGHEFAKRKEMERSCLVPNLKRSKVFYCEPNRSDEKGHCEKNHTHIRYVIPKGASLEPFIQSDISLMMNHINSYFRKSLHGKTPYDVAEQLYPEDFFVLLGLEKIPPDKVILSPKLLKHSN